MALTFMFRVPGDVKGFVACNIACLLIGLLLFLPQIASAAADGETTQQALKQTTEQTTIRARQSGSTLPELIHESSEHFTEIDSANLDGLLERIADARVVLLGEATHGTAEFYDMRARITRELIEKKGFTIVAVEAEWPDAESIDHYIRGPGHSPFDRHRSKAKPFTGFPSWMWANHSVLAFTHWLKVYNQGLTAADKGVGFYGLDLYNMYSSIEAVLDYLHEVDPQAAEDASWSYGCLKPWSDEPSLYSRAMQSGRHSGCGYEVNMVLQDLRKNRTRYIQRGSLRYFSAEQNARLVRNGERYYRTMYDADNDSWNQRDQNMLETLQAILRYRGPTSKAVVWAHNSHIGDARATSRTEHGEINLGQLVRETFADKSYLVGFGTDHGTVAAASEWGGPMQVMQVRASHEDSYERLCHDAKADNFLLPLRDPIQPLTRKKLMPERLARAIGTSYDAEDELRKHYYKASLPRQFDEYIWFDETHAVKPLRKY
jgi:protein-L-isoaspartate(D-aspartate) O-methyltransferase